MTIICALYDDEARKFWLGCNSGTLIGDTIMPEHSTKWIRFGNWAMAIAGRGIAGDVVKAERAKFPNQSEDIVQVISFIRTAFEKYHIGDRDDGAMDYSVSGLIVHTSGALYDFDIRLSVSPIPAGVMWACGSGMEFALGADMALKTKGFGSEERLATAILAAIDLDRGCPGEPIVESFG